MLFRSRPPDNELALTINNVVLPRLAATKFLGIIIDDKLGWTPHIQSVKSKLSSVLSIMYKSSKLINTAGIWGDTYPSNVKCLFTLQNKAIRQICNADRLDHTNAMFKDMSILNLSEFVNYKTAIVMFLYDVSFDTKLHVNEQSICKLYKLHNANEQYATVGVLRYLINCRDGINDIHYFNYDDITVIIDELCTN